MNENERQVLNDVAAMRLAQATQLQRLQDLRSPMPVRTFRRLLARLDAQDVLFRLQRTIGGKAMGSSGFVYGIDVNGQKLLDQDPRRPWTPRPAWLRHALQTSELHVQLREAEAQGLLKVRRFEAEPTCWRSFASPGGGIVDLKPDAFIELDVGDFIDSYFIETDLATESPRTIHAKTRAYLDYFNSGVEQAAGHVFPLVAFLVPDDHRRAVIQDVINRLGDQAELFVVSTFQRIPLLFIEEPP